MERPVLLFSSGAAEPEVLDGPPAPPGRIECRLDPLRGEEVLYAAGRQERTHLPDAAACPLCPGGEVPAERFEIAVFRNRFPALAPPEGDAEVVVYTDDHTGALAALAPERVRLLVDVWRHRTAALGARPEVRCVMPFENRGEEVGVTLHHPHGQLYAFPFLPPVAAAERAADARLGGCAACALAAEERTAGVRMVWEGDGAVAYVPRAARWPYEVHLVLTAHRAELGAATQDDRAALAAGLRAVARGLDALWGTPMPYVMTVHQGLPGEPGGHVRVVFAPARRAPDRLKFLAGCEQGAGTFLNDRLPEETAPELREAIARGA